MKDSDKLLKQLELDIENCTNPKFIEIDEVYESEIIENKKEESQSSSSEISGNVIKNY